MTCEGVDGVKKMPHLNRKMKLKSMIPSLFLPIFESGPIGSIIIVAVRDWCQRKALFTSSLLAPLLCRYDNYRPCSEVFCVFEWHAKAFNYGTKKMFHLNEKWGSKIRPWQFIVNFGSGPFGSIIIVAVRHWWQRQALFTSSLLVPLLCRYDNYRPYSENFFVFEWHAKASME